MQKKRENIMHKEDLKIEYDENGNRHIKQEYTVSVVVHGSAEITIEMCSCDELKPQEFPYLDEVQTAIEELEGAHYGDLSVDYVDLQAISRYEDNKQIYPLEVKYGISN